MCMIILREFRLQCCVVGPVVLTMIDWRKVHPLGILIFLRFFWAGKSKVTLCDVPRVLPLLARCVVKEWLWAFGGFCGFCLGLRSLPSTFPETSSEQFPPENRASPQGKDRFPTINFQGRTVSLGGGINLSMNFEWNSFDLRKLLGIFLYVGQDKFSWVRKPRHIPSKSGLLSSMEGIQEFPEKNIKNPVFERCLSRSLRIRNAVPVVPLLKVTIGSTNLNAWMVIDNFPFHTLCFTYIHIYIQYMFFFAVYIYIYTCQ